MWIYFSRSLIGVRILMYQLRAQVEVGGLFERERIR
jgi:hypothetical protein